MRIAIVNHRSGHVGGVESYLAWVMPALARRGHELAGWFEEGPHPSKPSAMLKADTPSWVEPVADARTTAELREWRPDVMFVHGLRSPASERTLQRIAPAVFFAHSYYGTCISGAKMHRLPFEQVCSRRFGAGCLAAYYPRRCGGISPVTMLRQYQLQKERLTLLSGYRRIIVGSAHMRDEYTRHGFNEKLRLVPLAIPAVTARPRAASRLPSRLLYLGRLEAEKGIDIALEAAALAAGRLGRDLRLQISGAGSLRAAVQRRAEQLMAAQRHLQVVITDWLDEADVATAIETNDLLLMPSTWPEPFGLVGLEAAARGVPAIAFAVGGIPEWLIDDVTGRLVDAGAPNKVDGFAGAIAGVLGDAHAFARMSEACYAGAARFGMEAHLAGLEGVLEEATLAPAHR